MTPILQVTGLSGGYTPSRNIIHELSFEIQSGQIVGMIGVNGAGKTTTIKHILGLLFPFAGEIRVKGKTLKEDVQHFRSAMAYVPEIPLLYEELTVQEHMKLSAMAYGLQPEIYHERVQQLAAQFKMQSHMHKLSSILSKGMKQKVMIMASFLVRPDLYIIDEPFVGLDPLATHSLLQSIAALKREGASFLISSHNLSYIEKYCDKYIILNKGRMAAKGTLAEIRASVKDKEATLSEAFFALVGDHE